MQFKHELTLYVEGRKDEGSYQCVDSTSDVPVKKTIHVILSKLFQINELGAFFNWETFISCTLNE